jgi:hypothetical protein
VAFALLQQRHRLRRDLDLPHDGHDDLADQIQDAVLDTLDEHGLGHEAIALLFWPRTEFDLLLSRWPALADAYGQTWDEHRTVVEQTLVGWSEAGHPRMALMAGSVEELAELAERNGGEATDAGILDDYAQHLDAHPRAIAWPPGRNQSCWCGSGQKYKKCCLQRSRT